MTKISVIVPVYNAEGELNKAVDSILKQTEKNLEVILVDDGSKDNSFAVCKAYASQDKRVKVIQQANSGVSVARNRGLEVAQGEYIGFVDSDDWIEADMYETLLMEAQRTNADVVMCDATTVYSNGKTQADTIRQLSESTVLQKTDFTPALLLEMAGSACRCIYKNPACGEKWTSVGSFDFPLGVKFSEDRIFNLYAFGYASSVSYIKKSYYNRFMNLKSAVHRFHPDYFEAYKKAAEETEIAICLAWNANEELQTAYLSQFISGAIMAINNYYYKTSTLTKRERKKAVVQLCEDEQLRSAIVRYGANRHSRWILNRNYTALIAYAKLANWKHGR